jgi:hypothetical protein
MTLDLHPASNPTDPPEHEGPVDPRPAWERIAYVWLEREVDAGQPVDPTQLAWEVSVAPGFTRDRLAVLSLLADTAEEHSLASEPGSRGCCRRRPSWAMMSTTPTGATPNKPAWPSTSSCEPGGRRYRGPRRGLPPAATAVRSAAAR